MSALAEAQACSIPLRDRGGNVVAYALVDEDDYAALAVYRWCLSTNGYARRGMRSGGRRVQVRMARQILGLVIGDGLQVDHINRNRLDNRKANLRILRHAQNQQNRAAYKGSTSRFRGVCWDKRRGCWRATIFLSGRQRHVGQFADELDAARAVEAVRRIEMPFAEPEPALAHHG